MQPKTIPGGHGDVVNAVLQGIGGGLTVVGTEDLGHVLAVEQVAHEQQHDTENEGNHRVSSLNIYFPAAFAPDCFYYIVLVKNVQAKIE